MKRLLVTPRIEYIDNAWKYFVNESYITALLPYDNSLVGASLAYDGSVNIHKAFFTGTLFHPLNRHRYPVWYFIG